MKAATVYRFPLKEKILSFLKVNNSDKMAVQVPVPGSIFSLLLFFLCFIPTQINGFILPVLFTVTKTNTAISSIHLDYISDKCSYTYIIKIFVSRIKMYLFFTLKTNKFINLKN